MTDAAPDSATRPAAPRASISVPVLAGGLLTTAIALAGVWWLAHNAADFNVMNFYAWFIVPVGPLIVGLVAGSGYGLVARLAGARVGGGTLAAVVVLQLAAYVVAQYIDYQEFAALYSSGAPSFVEYLDESTRAISFSSSRGSGGATGPLGLLGYGIRLLEVVGFVGGAFLILSGVRGTAYCDACGRYMSTDEIGLIPAAAVGKAGVFSGAEKKAALAEASEEARTQGLAAHDALFALAEAGKGQAFGDGIRALRDGPAVAPAIINLSLTSCKECRQGTLTSEMAIQKGRDTHTEAMRSLEVSSAFVKEAGL